MFACFIIFIKMPFLMKICLMSFIVKVFKLNDLNDINKPFFENKWRFLYISRHFIRDEVQRVNVFLVLSCLSVCESVCGEQTTCALGHNF